MLSVLILGFVVANFGYQAITSRDWERAFERSYFQMVACVITYTIVH